LFLLVLPFVEVTPTLIFNMRSFIAVLALAASLLVQAVPALADTSAECLQNPGEELCLYDTSSPTVTKRDFSSHHLTNAERFARGLPLPAPYRRGSPTRRSTPSQGVTTSYRGYIEVYQTSDNSLLGYVSNNAFSGAQVRYQPSQSDALIVDFSLPVGATSGSNLQLTVESWNVPNFNILGFIQGRDDTSSDLAVGSYNYLYFGGTNPTNPNSTPQDVGNSYTAATGLQRTSESDVWSVDLVTGALSGVWTNTDGSEPTLACFTQSSSLYCSGDATQFNAQYTAPITPFTLKFVPI